MVSQENGGTLDFVCKAQAMCDFSNELGVRGGSTFPNLWFLVGPAVCGEGGMPFVSLSVTMVVSRRAPVGVLWVGGAGSVWQVTASKCPRNKSTGLTAACSPGVTFPVFVFTEPSDWKPRTVQRCVAELMLPAICSCLYFLIFEGEKLTL